VAELRVADVDEAPVLAELHNRSALVAYRDIFPPEAPPPTLERLVCLWESWLGSGQLLAFVAELAGEAVGVTLAGADPVDGSLGHLARMYVDPQRWGQGIGRALYAAAIGHLRDEHYPEATLWVLEANHRARSWYERLGWTETGERQSVYQPAAIDELRYRRVLAG
jgi:GNAT superfamily N-acetyltransferase